MKLNMLPQRRFIMEGETKEEIEFIYFLKLHKRLRVESNARETKRGYVEIIVEAIEE